MKKFINKIAIFCIPITLLLIVSILIPATPRTKKSLFSAKTLKDSLLQNVKSPRIIFIGGSNLSFGLNSKMIKDSLHVNVINTGIHASIGLKYMLDNTLPYIEQSDIIIISPEYQHFYGDYIHGRKQLLVTLDLYKDYKKINYKQYRTIYKYGLKYFISKYNIREYLKCKESLLYGVNSFNQFGDVYKHWGLNKKEFSPSKKISNCFNNESITLLQNFRKKALKKKAEVFITFPCLQKKSYDASKAQILFVEEILSMNNFTLLGSPSRYTFADSMMFNTPYHLNKSGVDLRTKLIIEDLSEKIQF